MQTLLNLQNELFQAQCSVVFSMIESQQALGISNQELRWMPRALVLMLPVKSQTFEWRGLLKLVRVFDTDKAKEVLAQLGFDDFPAYLTQHGYRATKQEFIERLGLHVQSEQAKLNSLF